MQSVLLIRSTCSTPFGITEFRGAMPASLFRVKACVLNAFRHHGVSRAIRQVHGQGHRVIRAQRLSASRSFADWPALEEKAARCGCSTPFGITEFRGPLVSVCQRHFPGAQRLSASQSFAASQTLGIAEFRAQRLSASQSFAESAQTYAPSGKGAQRLSASPSFAD